VVAAKMSDLRGQIPSLPSGEPLFVLVSADGTAQALHATVPRYSNFGRGAFVETEAADEKKATQRIAVVGALVQRSIPVPAAEVARLAADARARLVKQRVPGSFWANATGCGSRIEGDPDDSLQPACGMGHVPKKSSRFLYLYARTPSEERKRTQEKKGTSL